MNVLVERPSDQFDAAVGICVARNRVAVSREIRLICVMMQQQDLVDVADVREKAGEKLTFARVRFQPLLDAGQRLAVRIRLHRDDRDVIGHCDACSG